MAAKTKKIKLYYFNRFINFGDELNPFIFERLFNVKVARTSREFAECVAIGSILGPYLWSDESLKSTVKCYIEKFLLNEVKVYGSGFMKAPVNSNKAEKFRRNLKFYAVRGKLTRDRIEKIENKSLSGLPIGDPGLLLSRAADFVNSPKKYKFGIIPHYFDREEPSILKLAETLSSSRLINVLDPPEKVTKEITECEIIISTAMHGLIAADSFNIPNIWAVASDKIHGKGYKFRDYYSVYDINSPEPVNLNEIELNDKTMETMAGDYSIDPKRVKEVQESLIKAFPF